jgi:hypothetical protein
MTVSTIAGDIAAQSVTDWARLGAAVMVLLCFTAYSLLTRWWRDLALLATWLLFVGLMSVLVLAVTSRYDWYPVEWKPWVAAGVWLFIGALFTAWLGAYLWTQLRPVRLRHAADARRRDKLAQEVGRL